MVGPPYDCLLNPLGAVRSAFEKAVGTGCDPSSFDGKDWGAVDLFRHFLFEQGHLPRAPMLDPCTVKRVQPNTLVRFRGMIQDMLGNEFYVGAYKDGSIWRTNKFTDVSQFPMGSSPDVRVWERRLLYCIPVPGLNPWAESSSEAATERCMEWSSCQRDKRSRTEPEASECEDCAVSSDAAEGSPSAKKMREEGHPFPSSQSQDPKTEGACSSTITALNVGRDSLPCLVKIYDSPESELKLNDVFEFVGVVTFDSELTVEQKDELSDGVCDDLLLHLPPSKVPRLHCIIPRKLAVYDFVLYSPLIDVKAHLVKDVREALLRYLTAVLGNDAVAAHFVFLHILSKVHARVDDAAVGKFSLNLTCLNKDSVSVFGTQLIMALKNLLPFTSFIPLTLEYLNTASLAPKKDYRMNRLMPGVLQLAEGSHLIIDETQLGTGTLSSTGIENARLLKHLIEFQKVEYDFTYYKMGMAADVQLLVLSEGKSNILPADIIMPLLPSSSRSSSEVVAGETLDAWRWYLARVRSVPHEIESEMQEVVENDMVAERQADRSLGSRDFSRWLTMGRLISSSFGQTSLSLEHWQMVKELERLRRERLNETYRAEP